MITIIHGEDIISHQKYKSEIIEKNKGVEIIDLENPNETDLEQAIESKSLFGDEKIVILSGKFDDLSQIINSSEIPIYIFSEKNLSNKILSQFPKAKIIFNKPKAAIFEFLDTLRLDLFIKLKEEPELIFYMLVRQFRNLILVTDGSWTSELSPWQKNKLLSQSKRFTLEKLLNIYKCLEKIDYDNKTGQNPLDLSKTLELFLLKI